MALNNSVKAENIKDALKLKTIQNIDKNEIIRQKPGDYTERYQKDLNMDAMMQNSIQGFLEETKSIEEDLMKLKQLSVEKHNSPFDASERMHNRYMQRIPMRDYSSTNPQKEQINSFSRNKWHKPSRSVDHSLDRDALAQHLNMPFGDGSDINSTCKD